MTKASMQAIVIALVFNIRLLFISVPFSSYVF